MNEPNISLIGVYKLEYNNELINKAIELKYGENHKNDINYKNMVIDELNNVYLIELLVENPDSKFRVDDINQDNNDQAPYDESYYSIDYKIDYNYEMPNIDKFKLLFWFHYLDINNPLNTSYGKVYINKVDKMPEYLINIKKYEPVD